MSNVVSSYGAELLHPQALDRIPVLGSAYKSKLTDRISELGIATLGLCDPAVSVVIRTRNHEHELEGLFDDFSKQNFGGETQVIVVDTESSDRTKEVAKSHGATIVDLSQEKFNYPLSLNAGFEVADNPWVFTLTGNSSLTSKNFFKSLTRWHDHSNVGGVFGAALPNNNATLGDIVVSMLQSTSRRLDPAELVDGWVPGAMVAHRSAVRRSAWEEVGGYDIRYGRGGEDTKFAKDLLGAGLSVAREPALSVHRSHGLGLIATAKLVKEWRSLRGAGPQPFDHGILNYRKDLQR